MPLVKYSKSPGETKRYAVDYDDWLDTGEQLTNITFEITPITVPPLTIASEVFEAGNRAVQFFVSGGVDHQTYRVLLTVETTGGQIKEVELLYAVGEL